MAYVYHNMYINFNQYHNDLRNHFCKHLQFWTASEIIMFANFVDTDRHMIANKTKKVIFANEKFIHLLQEVLYNDSYVDFQLQKSGLSGLGDGGGEILA